MKYLKYKLKYIKLKRKQKGGNISNLINTIYNNLIYNNFYDNINIQYCKGQIASDPTIDIPTKCKNRFDEIKSYKSINGFNFFVSPCRIGRESKFCSQRVQNCLLTKNAISCPICNISDRTEVNPCRQLNNIIITELDDMFILLPNAYPYLEKQFLITTKNHILQIDLLDNIEILSNLINIFVETLDDNSVIFFNGICGNSLEHFHCQYTTSKFPIFDQLQKDFTGFYQNNLFRGYVCIIPNKDVKEIFDLIQKIKMHNLTYNFITRKISELNLQIIFFIRFCHVNKNVKDLNFGATELSGVIVSNKELSYSDTDITNYLDSTNRISDYEKFSDS